MLRAFGPDIRCAVIGILVLVGGVVEHNLVIDAVGVALMLMGGIVWARRRWIRRSSPSRSNT